MGNLISRIKRSQIFDVVLCVACIILLCCLCKMVVRSHNIMAYSNQKLCMNVIIDNKAGLTTISAEQSGKNHADNITYLGISDVSIDIDGKTWELEDAIHAGTISVDEMIFYVRSDAKNGFCEETAKSNNGLARFTYRYPEFDIIYIYDIYETPDQKQHIISEFAICAPDRSPSFLYVDEESGKPIDYEDWGLIFEVVQMNGSEITLKCTQQGGQQIGKLIVEYYDLYKINTEDKTETHIEPLIDDFSGEFNTNSHVVMEGTTDIVLDLSEKYGKLSDGDYIIYFTVKDQYNEGDTHSLMRNYYDRQRFGVPFAIYS